MAYLKIVSPVVPQRFPLAGSSGDRLLQIVSAEFTRWFSTSALTSQKSTLDPTYYGTDWCDCPAGSRANVRTVNSGAGLLSMIMLHA